MKENEVKGNLSQTLEDHYKIGGSGSGLEGFIEGKVVPNIPFGQQMTDEALKKYYIHYLSGVRSYFGLTPEQRIMLMPVADGFKADFPYLESRGIDTTDAKLVFEQLKK